MKNKGISVHIGVRTTHAAGCPTYTLNGPVNDACAMAEYAANRGFRDITLFGAKAKYDAVDSALSAAAEELNRGDILLITFSGHGSRIEEEPSRPTDEHDRYDEMWCLDDREMLDDQLSAKWTEFRAGVRIVVVSDSCKSGAMLLRMANEERRPALARELKGRFRVQPEERENLSRCDDLMKRSVGRLLLARRMRTEGIDANVLLLAACGGTKNAQDGCPHSLFTRILLDEVRAPGFDGTYAALMARVRRRVKSESGGTQTPGVALGGIKDPALLCERAFSI
jgi:hypothetical protein